MHRNFFGTFEELLARIIYLELKGVRELKFPHAFKIAIIPFGTHIYISQISSAYSFIVLSEEK